LLDAELLADCYLELIGGRQTALMLSAASTIAASVIDVATPRSARPRPLVRAVTREEEEAHALLVADLGASALWRAIEERASLGRGG